MVRILSILERPFTSMSLLGIGVAVLALPKILAALTPVAGLSESLTIAVAGILIAVASLLPLGYGIRCARDAFGELPDWSHTHHILEDSIKALVPIIVYMLPATFLSAWAYPTLEEVLPAITAGDPAAIIALILALIAFYLLPAALMLFIEEGVLASLNIAQAVRKSVHIHYAGDWLLAACLSILASAIMWSFQEYALEGTLQLVIFLIVSSFLALLVTIWSFTIYGQVWEELE